MAPENKDGRFSAMVEKCEYGSKVNMVLMNSNHR